jgi:hypothetical protein
MLKITTKWVRAKDDEQVTPQHFQNEAHYYDYAKVMMKRGFAGELLEVQDVHTGQNATIKDNKFKFNLGGSNA